MSPGSHQPGYDNDDHVLVSPRHLAGGTTREGFTEVVSQFRPAYDWQTRPARFTLISIVSQSAVHFASDRQDGILWQLIHKDPYWTADFTRNTPAEAIAAVTRSLHHRHGSPIEHITTSDGPPSLRRTATVSNWRSTDTGWTSPDGHCSLAYDADTGWCFTASVHNGPDDALWTAKFSRNASEPLVSTFLAHLALGTPVRRRFGDIPRAALDAVSITPDPHRGASSDGYAGHAEIPLVPRDDPARKPRRSP